MKNIPAICSGRDVFFHEFRRAHTGAWGIYAGLPRAPLIICEALPYAVLRTFFEKKVLSTPKKLLIRGW